MPGQPYRDPPPAEARRAPESLVCPWRDSERRVHPVGAFYRAAFGTTAAALLWSISYAASLAAAAVTVFLTGRDLRAFTGLTVLRLSVSNDTLFIEARDAPLVTVSLASLRDVELDGKAIQRVTYHQSVGAALPTTHVSQDVDVARVVFALDDGSIVRLTDSYAAYSECLDRFGKVRVFLRAHGWLPADERDKRPPPTPAGR